MKRVIGVLVILAGLGLLAGCVPEQHAMRSRHVAARSDTTGHMTKQDVISLTRAGVSDSLIVGMMDASESYFDLTTQDVLDLKNAGVHDGVIKAMLAAPPDDSSDGKTATARYAVYPPYWYRYDPFWDPWYYPAWSWGFGYRSYHPVFVRHVFPSHGGGFHAGVRHR